MAELLSPGVYVEEAPSSIRSIAGVSTSTAGFIGVLGDAPEGVSAAAGVPKLVTNFSEFKAAFGDFSPDPARRNLAHAVYGFFNNGGSRCYVSWVAKDADFDAPLLAFEAIDEIALVAAPGVTTPALLDKLATHCSKEDGRNYRFAILDGPQADLSPYAANAATAGRAKNSEYAALYVPWLMVFDPAEKKKTPTGNGMVAVPPSGHVAGVYARVDNARGVHKAPANEAIVGVQDVSLGIGRATQDTLNLRGINCIRVLDNRVMVWGGRTLGGESNGEMRYINVRRTMLFLRKSIDQGTRWVVFEPNTPALWKKIVRNVSAFLTDVWRAGALFGETEQQAFYVRCDEELNPSSLRNVGQVVTEIGVAIARPAEFVVFKISQYSAE